LPRLMFDVRELEDFTAFSTALPNLVDVGTPVPVSWVQKKLGIPAPLKDEPVLARAIKAAPPPMNLMAQLMALQNGDAFPDQSAIDRAVDALPAATLQAQSTRMLGDLVARLSNAKNDAEALGLLAEAFPGMDPHALADGLGDRLFIARLVGMHSAQQESGSGRG